MLCTRIDGSKGSFPGWQFLVLQIEERKSFDGLIHSRGTAIGLGDVHRPFVALTRAVGFVIRGQPVAVIYAMPTEQPHLILRNGDVYALM